MKNFPIIETDIKSGRYADIMDDVLYVLNSFEHKSENDFFKRLGWFVVGMLEHAEALGLTDKRAAKLDKYVTDRIKPYETEDAILNDLYDVFWWGDIKTAVAASRYLQTDLNRSYDDVLVKSIAMELLYNTGCHLLKYQ